MKTKKIILSSILGIVLTSLLIIGCKKGEDEQAHENTKESTSTQSTSTSAQSTGTNPIQVNTIPGGPIIMSPFSRAWSDLLQDCFPIAWGCLPDVIVRPHFNGYLIKLDLAIEAGPEKVANLFTNEEVALQLIPDWNGEHEDMVIFKEKLLSGHYTFIKKTTDSKIFYFMGNLETLSLDNYEYVLPFKQ